MQAPRGVREQVRRSSAVIIWQQLLQHATYLPIAYLFACLGKAANPVSCVAAS